MSGKLYVSLKWTEKEKELFIEGLNLHGRNYTKISMHVRTKNNDQVKYYSHQVVKSLTNALALSEIEQK